MLVECCVCVGQIWKQKLQQMGGSIAESFSSKGNITHVFAADSHSLLQCIDSDRLARFKGVSDSTISLRFIMNSYFGIELGLRFERSEEGIALPVD